MIGAWGSIRCSCRLGCLGLICALAMATPATAGGGGQFVAASLKTILQGEFDGVGATEAGNLVVAPQSQGVFPEQVAYVWSLLPDGDGGVFAATGSDGRLYRIRPDGTWEVLAETFEYELFALAVGEDGAVYISGAPNGTITRVRGGSDSETVLDLPEGLVLDLLVAPSGDLYASTGERGEIYRIPRDGEPERVAALPDAHAVCLAWWQDRLLCGTDGHGLLASVDPQSGEVEVLYDTGKDEVVCVLPLEDGRVIFAANGGSNSQGGESRNGLFLPTVEVRANGGPVGPALYELGPGKMVKPVWECPEQDILSLCSGPDGSILVGTGADGVLYSLDERWDATRLLDLDEAQLLSLAGDERAVYVGTGNGGAVYRLDWNAPREGTYTSRVWDAGLVSKWGVARYVAHGDGDVTFETRSGQVREPGETWSPWHPLAGERIASPPGRFLQWRARLSTREPEGFALRDVRISYRGPNRQPVLTDVNVTTKGAESLASAGRPTAFQQTLPGGVQIDYTVDEAGNGVAAQSARPGIWARSLRTAAWTAKDPDRDPLRFELHLRRLDEEVFVPLKLKLEETAYTWDATAWPEGWYELKVVASDEQGNPPGEELSGERISQPFQIDNTPPTLRDLQLAREAGGLVLSGEARDETSRISSLEYSLDGDGWHMATPSDGLLDSPRETFRISVPSHDDGRQPTYVGVRIADEVGHVAASRLRAPAP